MTWLQGLTPLRAGAGRATALTSTPARSACRQNFACVPDTAALPRLPGAALRVLASPRNAAEGFPSATGHGVEARERRCAPAPPTHTAVRPRHHESGCNICTLITTTRDPVPRASTSCTATGCCELLLQACDRRALMLHAVLCRFQVVRLAGHGNFSTWRVRSHLRCLRPDSAVLGLTCKPRSGAAGHACMGQQSGAQRVLGNCKTCARQPLLDGFKGSYIGPWAVQVGDYADTLMIPNLGDQAIIRWVPGPAEVIGTGVAVLHCHILPVRKARPLGPATPAHPAYCLPYPRRLLSGPRLPLLQSVCRSAGQPAESTELTSVCAGCSTRTRAAWP